MNSLVCSNPNSIPPTPEKKAAMLYFSERFELTEFVSSKLLSIRLNNINFFFGDYYISCDINS